MSIQSTRQHQKRLVATAMLTAVSGMYLAPTSFAKLSANTVNPQATVADNGRHLIVTGPIQGTVSERCEVRVTVTQRSTGAVAEGRVVFNCSGDIEQWQIRATTQGKATFQPGPATAVAMARTTANGNTATDAHQWLVNMTLVSQ